jgi:hypothetical protein
MTQEIIEMANKAFDESSFTDAEVIRFAKLVAAHVSRELAKEFAGMGKWDAVHIIEGVRW